MTRPPKVRTILEAAAGDVGQAIVEVDRGAIDVASALVYKARRDLGTARGLLLQELEVRRRTAFAQELAKATAAGAGGRP